MIMIRPLPSTSLPAPIEMTLTCDGDHGLLSVKQAFQHENGFIGTYDAAMKAGWKASMRHGCRIFLCRECSGKRTLLAQAIDE